MSRWLVLLPWSLAACSSPDPWHQPVRFAVLPHEQQNVDGDLRLGIAWIPVREDDPPPPFDRAIEVPGVGVDFGWPLDELVAPESARRECDDGCDQLSSVALGWIVAFIDGDGTGDVAFEAPTGAPFDAGRLSTVGVDELAGIAADHVVAAATGDLLPDDPLARRLGWAVPAGVHVMRVRREAGRELLEPTTSRERVVVWLAIGRTVERALCCGAQGEGCRAGALTCPSFPEEP